MTDEEIERIAGYSKRIEAADGKLGVLSDNESHDLEILLMKWIYENEGGESRKQEKLNKTFI